MKLRKALDKASKERLDQQGGPEVEGGIEHGQAPASPDLDQSRESEGWQGPVYSQSMSVKLDPQKLAGNRCICISPEASELDAFKVLRTRIQQRTKEQGLKTIMVTSARPMEGKTLIAINLALTFAREYHQTALLVDCDLKKQDIHHYLGFASDRGLIDYLEYDRPLKDFIIWPGIEKLTLISGGRTVKDSTELLGSPKMKKLVEDMKNRYADRYVLLDVPAVMAGADAMVFAPLVDGIVMVVDKGVTSMPDVKKAVELLPSEKLLGFVLNERSM